MDLLAQAAKLPGVRVVVIGDGPARSRVRRALPTAVFLGARHGQQLAKLYTSLDIFVHTGRLETLGQTVQEALASGLPVVAPAAGGPLDLVEHGRTGYLVSPRDGAAIAGAVAELVADADLRRKYGEAARASDLGRTWTTIGDELLDHYRAAIASAVVADDPVAEEAEDLVAEERVIGGNVTERSDSRLYVPGPPKGVDVDEVTHCAASISVQ